MEEKKQPKYKVGQKIWEVKLQLTNKESSYSPNGLFIKELKVIGVSKYKVCLNDDWFTTLDNDDRENYKKERNDCYRYANDIRVDIRTCNHILGDGVYANMFSTTKPNDATLKKIYGKISNQIDKQYGFLFKDVKDKIWDIIGNYKLD